MPWFDIQRCPDHVDDPVARIYVFGLGDVPTHQALDDWETALTAAIYRLFAARHLEIDIAEQARLRAVVEEDGRARRAEHEQQTEA